MPEAILPSGCAEEPQEDSHGGEAVPVHGLCEELPAEGRLPETHGGQTYEAGMGSGSGGTMRWWWLRFCFVFLSG